MKTYFGKKVDVGPATIFIREDDGKEHFLPRIIKHSPDGFQWGYGGSGPSDAALSILSDFAGRIIGDRYYQEFKAKFIAPVQGDLLIKGEDIMAWLKEKKEAQGYL